MKKGGIYLDTDVELYDSLELFCNYDAFFFFQNHKSINTGMGFGSSKGNWILKEILEDYENLNFDIENLSNIACPIQNTIVLKNNIKNNIKELNLDGSTQYIHNFIFVDANEYYQIAHHYGEFSWKNDDQKISEKYQKKI